MHKRWTTAWWNLPLLAACMLAFFLGQARRAAAREEPTGPDRFIVIQEQYTIYEWWMTAWEDNQVACSLRIDHEGLPSAGEVYAICGKAVYDRWVATQPCQQSESAPQACSGYYLVLSTSEAAIRQVAAALPEAVVWITLDGCYPENSSFRCADLPILVLTGEEPLAAEHILSLAGRVDGRGFLCDPLCQVELGPTGEDGILIEFWAYSSYGDSSERYEARVRVTAADDPSDRAWYVDVLSDRWRGDPLPGCAQVWEAFPAVGGVPAWLATPMRAEQLASDISYEYLAAQLLRQGVADAAGCTDGGLTLGGQASPCGLQAAAGAVTAWQNRFDGLIFSVARDSGVPAQLLKNLFGRESQFWPGLNPGRPEAGLGQLTENGADTTLLWNQPFFEQFCPTVLEDSICRRGYPHLPAAEQLELRRALVRSVDAFCADCPLGIDLARAENSVGIFAETLLANCAQTGMLIRNTYSTPPGEQTSYEDLWRLTLVNYNAGPGCLTLAIQETSRLGENLDWQALSSHLTTACQGALSYVDQISQVLP